MKTHGVSGQLDTPAALTPGQTPGYRLNRRLGGSQGQYGRFWDATSFAQFLMFHVPCTDQIYKSFKKTSKDT